MGGSRSAVAVGGAGRQHQAAAGVDPGAAPLNLQYDVTQLKSAPAAAAGGAYDELPTNTLADEILTACRDAARVL